MIILLMIPNNDWKHQGMLFGSTFIGYNEYGVSVDKKISSIVFY